jgi:hypothetical protein
MVRGMMVAESGTQPFENEVTVVDSSEAQTERNSIKREGNATTTPKRG